MKRPQTLAITLSLLFGIAVIPVAAYVDEIPINLVGFAETVLATTGQDPEIVRAVEAQNRRNLTLDQIKRIDEEWRNTEGITRFMLELMSNDLALLLHNIAYEHRYIVEIFVMDNQGANVGQIARTSDYWQGDEAKFIESYAGGNGSIHYGDIEYDDSADQLVVQISVPVVNGGRAIGAITFAVSLDRWERR